VHERDGGSLPAEADLSDLAIIDVREVEGRLDRAVGEGVVLLQTAQPLLGDREDDSAVAGQRDGGVVLVVVDPERIEWRVDLSTPAQLRGEGP